jgi:glycosyltransferase involved in cell wall biosynthesis
LKILITVGIFPPDIGGPASFVPKIAELYSNSGHDVTVVCLTDRKQTDNLNFKVVRILRNQNLLIRWIKTVSQIIRQGYNADLFFVNGLPMESYIANIFTRKKLIRKIVGDWAWERGMNKKIINESFDEFQNNKHNLHLEIAKFSRGWTATKANLIITPSNHLKNVVKGWGVKENSIKVIYNGTKLKNKPDPIVDQPNDYLKLITVGRLAPWKNIDIIIEALSDYKKANQNFIFYIVGSGPEEIKLKKLVNDLDLENFVTFTGQLQKEDLNYYLQKSDIYIQASSYEGLPHVILEAMSHNLSIISTPIGGTNEVIQDGKNGWVWELENNFKPNKNNLIEILNNLKLNSSDDINKRTNAQNLLFSTFDEDKNFQMYLELLK